MGEPQIRKLKLHTRVNQQVCVPDAFSPFRRLKQSVVVARNHYFMTVWLIREPIVEVFEDGRAFREERLIAGVDEEVPI